MKKHINRKLFIFVSILFILLIPHQAYAHALLENTSPAQDSQLETSPKEITLTFNERLEKELYSIKLFDAKGERVSTSATEMSLDQKSLIQRLPELPDGTYTVSYKILSADGHPVDGSYVFSIGEAISQTTQMNPLDSGNQETGTKTIISSTISIFYFLLLLLTTGWILWGTIKKNENEVIKKNARKVVHILQILLLLSVILMGFFQLTNLVNSWSLVEIWSILSNTTIGITWIVSFLLVIVGFLLLHRKKWIDVLWVFLLIAMESINGHANAFEPPIVTIAIDLFHLLAAAIWAGGLFYMVYFWRKQREHVKEMLPLFSDIALIAILLLIVTGISSTYLFLPKLDYLLYTDWGIMLICKVAIVLFVIIAGGILRYFMKKKKESSIGTMLAIDFSFMIIITGIVGVFTHYSPVPQNEPLAWSEQDEAIEFTTSILPKIPGNNHFMVVADAKAEGIEIKRIALNLTFVNNPDIAPIQVPFEERAPAKHVEYMIDGQYLPFAGKWTAEVRILDSEDNEYVYHEDFVVY
ncbi:copper resistance protein CopC/CopD [Caldibacillus lycopersici]|uniref:Copper resistance protein CopC/CopD n=1 Tax=Perspicuibacillus lycopersici TaxID=1325689 RepID=A0AAE3IX13_9BACI|nr:copper resistance protein CopC/CopD [Perspicuibacillus lycopersici]MCU9614946.1 copper resistance protein CopC/CopD [Perspicuibacillus lycopersici]